MYRSTIIRAKDLRLLAKMELIEAWLKSLKRSKKLKK